jgi:hypothetical protein
MCVTLNDHKSTHFAAICEKKGIFFRASLTATRTFAGSQQQNGKQQQPCDKQSVFHVEDESISPAKVVFFGCCTRLIHEDMGKKTYFCSHK